MRCIHCNRQNVRRRGTSPNGKPMFRCYDCRRSFIDPRTRERFESRPRVRGKNHDKRVRRFLELLAGGLSLRQAALRAHVDRGLMAKLYGRRERIKKCACGRLRNHPGTCRVRLTKRSLKILKRARRRNNEIRRAAR